MSDQPVRVISREEALRIVRQQQQRQQEQQQQQIQQQQEQQQQQKHQGQQEQQRQTSQQQQQQPRQQEQKQQQQTLQQQQQQRQQQLQRQQEQQQQRTSQQQQQQRQQEQQQQQQYRQQYQPQQLNNQQQKVFPAALPRGSDGSTGDVAGSIGWKSDEQGAAWCHDGFADADDDYDDDDDDDALEDDNGELYFDDAYVPQLERYGGGMGGGGMRADALAGRTESRDVTREQHPAQNLQRLPADSVTAQRLRLPHGISITPEVDSGRCKTTPSNTSTEPTFSSVTRTLPSGRAAPIAVVAGSRSSAGTRAPLEKYSGLGADALCSSVAGVQSGVRSTTGGVRLPRGITATLVVDESRHPPRSSASTPEAGVRQRDGVQASGVSSRAPLGAAETLRHPDHEVRAVGGIRQIPAGVPYDQAANDEHYEDEEYHEDFVADEDGDQVIDEMSDSEARSEYFIDGEHGKYIEEENASFGGDEWTHSQYPKVNSAGMLTPSVQSTQGDGRVAGDIRSVNELSSQRSVGASGRSEAAVSKCGVSSVDANAGQKKTRPDNVQTIVPRKSTEKASADCGSTSQPDWSSTQHIRLPPGVTLTSTDASRVQLPAKSPKPAQSSGRETPVHTVPGDKAAALLRLPPGVSVSRNVNISQSLGSDGGSKAKTVAGEVRSRGPTLSGASTPTDTSASRHYSGEYSQQQSGRLGDVAQEYGDETYYDSYEKDLDREAGGQDEEYGDGEGGEYMGEGYGATFADKEYYSETCNISEKQGYSAAGQFYDGEVYDGQQYADSGDHEVYEGEEYGDDDPEEYEDEEYLGDNQKYEGMECESGNGESLQSNVSRNNSVAVTDSVPANHQLTDPNRITSVESPAESSNNRVPSARASSSTVNKHSLVSDTAAHSQSLYKKYNLPSGIKLYPTAPIADSHKESSEMEDGAFEGDQPEGGCSEEEADEFLDEGSDCEDGPSPDYQFPASLTVRSSVPSSTNQRVNAALTTRSVTSRAPHTQASPAVNVSYSSQPSNEFSVTDSCAAAKKQIKPATRLPTSHETLQQLGVNLPKGISIRRQDSDTAALSEADSEVTRDAHSALPSRPDSVGERSSQASDTNEKLDSRDFDDGSVCDAVYDRSSTANKQCARLDMTEGGSPVDSVSDTTHRWPQSDIGTYKKLMRPGPRSARLAQLARLPPEVASSMMRAASGDRNQHLPSDGLFESTEFEDHCETSSVSDGLCAMDDDGSDEVDGHQAAHSVPERSGQICAETANMSDERSDRIVLDRLHDSALSERQEQDRSCGTRETSAAKSLTLQEARALCRQNVERFAGRVGQSDDRVPASVSKSSGCTPNVRSEKLPTAPLADGGSLDKYQKSPEQTASQTLTSLDTRSLMSEVQTSGVVCEAGADCRPGSADADSRDGRASRLSAAAPADIADGTHGEGRPASSQSDHQDSRPHLEKQLTTATALAENYDEEENFGQEGVEEEEEYAAMDEDEVDGLEYNDQHGPMEEYGQPAVDQTVASVSTEIPTELSSIIGQLGHTPIADITSTGPSTTTAVASAHPVEGTAEDLSEVKDMLDMLDEKPELLVGGECGDGGGGRGDIGVECAPLLSQDECAAADVTESVEEVGKQHQEQVGVVAASSGEASSDESDGEQRQELNDGDESEQDAHDDSQNIGKSRRRKRRKHRQKKTKDTDSSVVTGGSVADRADAGGDSRNSDEDDKPKNKRRNIRKILSEQKLDAETVRAQEEELERQQRLADQKRWFEQFRRDQERAKRQLDDRHALLVKQEVVMPSELDDLTVEAVAGEGLGISGDLQAAGVYAKPSDVITLSSDEDSGHTLKTPQEGLSVTVSEADSLHQLPLPAAAAAAAGGESSDDDIQLLSSTEEESTAPDDVDNSGAHTDDTCNVPDAQGRVLINVGHPPSEEDIFLAPQVARNIKSHQIGGVRFLYDNLIESQERCKNTPGFGCILAHSMGLGKTMQTVTFSDIFLRSSSHRLVLIIVPINTIQNWVNEFNYWIPPENCYSPLAEDGELRHRAFSVFVLGENHRTMQARSKVIQEWSTEGGVMLMGYEMYRLLSLSSSSRKKKKRSGADDVYAEEREKMLMENIKSALCKPGPDLVICDEGHRIKNAGASISQALKSIRTRRRLALTGYPLQNNLVEYWCMVDFVRPNFLGTKAEFNNMFERPISNGQCADSTQSDIRLMRFRAHVLHSLLEGLVQRRSQAILEAALPKKEEYVCLLRMSPLQRSLYKRFITDLLQRSGHTPNPLRAFIVSCKIWNHPDILYNLVRRKLVDVDLDLDDPAAANAATPGSVSGGTPKRGGVGRPTASALPTPPTPADLVGATAADMDPASMSSAATGVVGAAAPMPSEAGGEFVPGEVRAPLPPAAATAAPSTPREDFINYDWAQELLQNYTAGLLENSTKMQVFSAILDESVRLGDKMLLFSQSLLTLNIIEEFLQQRLVPGREERWTLNVNYYRLDGSTGGLERERLIHEFNNSEAVPLFLVSTRAGSLGVNLVGANRVLVFDASWNPCHDTQAVCRVYRFGQQKKCYIYRLVTDNSMERRIYDRQVKKQSMSNRIVDETNPENMVGANTLNRLLDPDEDDPHDDTLQIDADNYTDPVLRRVIAQHANLFTKEPFEHDKQLVDRRDKRLTQAEKRLAKRSYELEKKASASGMIRPGTRHMMGTMGMYRGMYTKPVANVRPMMTTGRGGGAAGAPMGAATSTLSTHRYSAEQLARQGVTMTHITVPKDVSIPTGTGEGEPIMLRRGQMVLVIKTAKGVYLRLQDGRIIAIRMPQGSASASNGVPDFLSGGVTTPASAPTARQPPTLGRLRGIGAARTVTMASGAEGAARADGVIRLPRSITVERVPSTESGIVSAPSASVPSRRAAVMAARGRGVTGRLGGVKRMVVPSRAAAAAVAAMAGGDASRSSVTVRSSGGTMIRRQTVHGPMGSVSLASAAPPGRVKVLVKPDSVPVLSRSDNTDYSSTPNVATSAPSAKEETTTSVSTPQLSPSNSSGDQLAPMSSAVSQSVSKARISTTVTTTLSQPPSYAASQLSSSMGSLPPPTSSAGTTTIDGRGGIDTADDNATPADAVISPPEGDGVGVTRGDSQFSVPPMMSVDSTLDSSLSQPMSLSSANSPANFMPSPSADLMPSQQQQHQQQHIFYNQPPQMSTANVAANSFSDTPWPPPATNVSSVQTVAGMSTSIPSAATSQQHPHSRLTSMAGEPPLQGTSAALTSSRQPQQFQPLHHRPQPSPIIQQHGSSMYPPVSSVGMVRTPSVEVPTSVVASGEWGQLAPGYPAPTAVDSGWLPGPSLGVSVGSGPWKPPQAPVTAAANESARRRQHKPSRQQQQQAELQRFSQQQQPQHYQQQQQQDRRVMTPSVASTTSGQFAELGSNPAIYSLQPQQQQQALQQQSLQSIKTVSVPSTADSGDALTQLQESCFATSLDSLGSNSGALASRAGVAPTPVEFDNRLRQHPDPYQPDLSHGQPQLTSQYVWPGHSASVDAQLANRGGDSAAGLVGYNDLMPSIGGYGNPVAGFSAASSHQLQPPMGGPTPVPTGGAGGGFQPIDYGGLPLGGHHHPHHLQPQQMHPHEMMPPTHLHPVPPAPPVYSHYTGYGGGSAAPGFPTHAPLPYSTLPTSYGAPTNHAPVHHLQPHQQQQPMMFPSVSQHQPPPPPPPPS